MLRRSGSLVHAAAHAIGAACLLFSLAASATGLVVIAHPEGGLVNLSRSQVIQYYTGRAKSAPGGEPVAMIDVEPARARFYQALLGRDVAEIDAYWARLKFSGQTLPPMLVLSDEAALERVARQRNAIAYINEDKVDKRVRVVLKLDQ